MKQLSNKTAVITGAGSGIGRATAIELSRHGCHLALADIHLAGLEETQHLIGTTVNRISLHQLDVADRKALAAFPQQVLATHPAIHILVNNAGITTLASFEELSDDQVQRIVDINFWGMILGCRHFLPILRTQPEAHIVNVSSMAAFSGMPYQTMYCATKAGVLGFTEALRAELYGTGIGITAVCPGAVGTNIMASAESPYAIAGRMGELLQRHGYPAERAGRKIVAGIRCNRSLVRIGGQAYALDWARRLAPWMVAWIMGQLGRQGRKRLQS